MSRQCFINYELYRCVCFKLTPDFCERKHMLRQNCKYFEMSGNDDRNIKTKNLPLFIQPEHLKYDYNNICK